jgi:hypothetical protein
MIYIEIYQFYFQHTIEYERLEQERDSLTYAFLSNKLNKEKRLTQLYKLKLKIYNYEN